MWPFCPCHVGATVESVQRMLGHASATLTLDRYGHLSPTSSTVLRRWLDEAVRQAGVYRMGASGGPAHFDQDARAVKDAA